MKLATAVVMCWNCGSENLQYHHDHDGWYWFCDGCGAYESDGGDRV